MPHQCVRCKAYYDDASEEIVKGCKCGGRLFFYIRKEKLEAAKKELEQAELKVEDKKEMEKDVFEMLGIDPHDDDPVILDFESIRVHKPGKYFIDLVNLFKKEPVIFKLEEGKYLIDLPETFKMFQKKGKREEKLS